MSTILFPATTTVVSPFGKAKTFKTPIFTVPTLTVSTVVVPNTLDHVLNDNPHAQSQVNEYIHYKFLDKWLPESFSQLLKYLKVSGGKVTVVKSKKERDGNNVDKASAADVEKMIDFIEDNILDDDRTRRILITVIEKYNIHWPDLPHNEKLVKHVIASYVKRQLNKMVEK